MKLSVAWIFDHINADWRKQDIPKLVDLFNQKTAEIEAFYPITFDLENLFLAQVSSVAQETVELRVPEINGTVELPKREAMQLHEWYMLKRDDKQWRYASSKELQQEHAAELPPFFVDVSIEKGQWKKNIDAHDYILEVDNKSITHRPDLWSHRGFAREVAILLDLPFKPSKEIIKELPIKQYDRESKATVDQPYVLSIAQPEFVKRFAVAYFANIDNRPSLPWMAVRLCSVDSKAINALIDMTNYVMLDVGQPMHAFDANSITSHTLMPRFAHGKETLTLLDGDTIELTEKDMIITDGTKPLALAGVMGGKESAVSSQTHAILLEAAHFEPTMIRHTAARYKKRTESAARFEKMLDPNQNIMAIERFVALLDAARMAYTVSDIISVGPEAPHLSIALTHRYIEEHLGVSLPSNKIIGLLQALECQVTTECRGDDTIYQVLVPTMRSTKDIRIKEDLLEEIGRLYGYGAITCSLPRKENRPFDVSAVYRQRRMKEFLAFGLAMHEVKNYAFYHASFLHELGWQPDNALSIQSPVSEEYRQLTTSLIPGLLANVQENHVDYDTLRFFEWGRIWQQNGQNIVEQSELTGIFFSKKDALHFYEIKAGLQDLFAMLKIPVTWHKEDRPEEPWFAPYQTARIMYNEKLIGRLGMIDKAFTHHLFVGNAIAFTLHGAFLANFVPDVHRYQVPSKYPAIDRDVSIMVPSALTVDAIMNVIASCSSHITTVSLLDFFEKKEWEGKKSVAFRITMQDKHKTLTHEDAERINGAVIAALLELGAQIR